MSGIESIGEIPIGGVDSNNYALIASSGTFSYSGVNSPLDYGYKVSPTTGSYTLTGVSANLKSVLVGYHVHGNAVNLVKTRPVYVTTGTYFQIGYQALIGLDERYIINIDSIGSNDINLAVEI